MAMSSIEYKELVVEFGKDIRSLADDLYEATTEELPAKKRAAVLAAGQKKVRDYEELLSRVQGAKNAEIRNDYGGLVEEIREFVRQLTEK